ncbi:WD repeat-containing protein 21 [Rhypophila decipiens]|uniref:WD repeat-containing protein 21 n=1 Tax=Rhypophila decipiens TaxID=261697 RepID=A0AAN7B9Z5_9PEZI|nr:WD repeat-containing protein 21 [Rhypophila decipiens]
MNRAIPGYYYDEEKKRYFKIEASRTAPEQASWASGNVKRRRLEDEKEEAKREREAKNAGRIKRAVGVWDQPLVGGCFLKRELGRTGTIKMEDMGLESWTMGLRDKGSLKMCAYSTGEMITSMYIGGGEMEAKSGLGVAYAVLDDHCLKSSYIPRDDQDQINFGYAAVRYPRTNFQANVESAHAPYLSSLAYHAPSHKMLLASSRHQARVTIGYLSPGFSVDNNENQPAWRLGTPVTCIHNDGHAVSKTIHTLRSAPSCSSVTAVVGTNRGILKLQGDNLSWLTWFPPSKKHLPHPDHSRGSGRNRGRGGRGAPFGDSSHQCGTNKIDNEEARPLHGEVLSLDFLAQNPAEVILAAGRSNNICLLDMRCSEHQGMGASYIRHKCSVAHVRSVGDYGVLAAGPRSYMAMYDVRFNSYRRHHNTDPTLVTANPVVTFPEYSNEAHLLEIGLDVSDRKDGGLGTVAAAQDDGTVALFSLKSGRKLRSSVVDGIKLDGAGRVFRSLMFQTLPGDRHPSLFVGGDGGVINKYSFGMKYSKRRGVVFEDED